MIYTALLNFTMSRYECSVTIGDKFKLAKRLKTGIRFIHLASNTTILWGNGWAPFTDYLVLDESSNVELTLAKYEE